MRSLRSRLIVSHTLPVLLIIPLMGIALTYVLERQVILVNLSTQLVGQAVLIANFAGEYPNIWENRVEAQAFVSRFNPDMTAELALLHPDGRVWIASRPLDDIQQEQLLAHRGLSDVLAGKTSVRVEHSQDLRAQVAEVLAPVIVTNGQVIGVIRLTHELWSVYQRFQRLRNFILRVMLPGLLLGVALGLIFAVNLERPLATLAHVMEQVSDGKWPASIAEQGPSEIQSVARAFNLLSERLRRLEDTRRQLLANLVHELGRPLGAIRSAVHALQIGAADDPVLRRDMLVGVHSELQRLERLLDDLARLYDRFTGRLELRRTEIALSDWLATVLRPWEQAAVQKGLGWQSHIDHELPTLVIDPDRMGQAVGNLLSNAIRYTPTGGVIETTAYADGDAVYIAVRDSGVGIAVEEQERIFDPFYRGHSGTRFPRGMGLGLSIARDLVEAHDGRLLVESTPGQGSCFTVILPYIGSTS